MRRLRTVVAAALLAATAAACAGDGAAFRRDESVDIVQPDNRAVVELPVHIRWEADLEAGPGGGPYYAVFVDRAPIRPGQSLRALADDSCDDTKGCPDLQYLRDRNVHVTDRTEVTLDVVPRPSTSQRTGARNRHEATIVVIDGDGRRIGEGAYAVEFEVES